MQYDLPLVVEEISHITVDLESSFSSITPGNTISLQYSVENRGNVDLVLNPTLQLPLGWIQNTVLEDFELSWTESRNSQFQLPHSKMQGVEKSSWLWILISIHGSIPRILKL